MKVGSARVSAEQQNLCNWVDGKKRGYVVIRQFSALAAEVERLVETEANDIDVAVGLERGLVYTVGDRTAIGGWRATGG